MTPARPHRPRGAATPLPARVAALAVTAAVVAAGCGGGAAAPAPPGGGSTLRATVADPRGDAVLARGPGEPLRDRGTRAPVGRTLATLAQLTDLHVRDEESPARAPFLDRVGGAFSSTFRPQEAFSTQVLDATVRAVDAERPQAVLVTGDITDSAQANELDQAIATLSGGRVDPDSGAPGYDGVQEPAQADPFYYRPDLDAPRRRGVLDAAQRPFTARGLTAPWYPVPGNHDVLAQGIVPPTAAIERVATGDRLVSSPDPDLLRDDGARDDPAAAVDRAIASGALSDPRRSQRVAADPARRLLAPARTLRRLAAAGARGTAVRGDRLDYAVDVGASVRAIALDTVNRSRDGATVSAAQLAWLREQVASAAAARRWILVFTHVPLERATGGDAALALLDGAPRVVAVLAGDRHRNTVTRRGHVWLIGTSSLADWPMQARMLRLRETPGGVALETWMVDQDGRGLAGTARELAYLDAQGGRPQRFAGGRADRNVRLSVP